MNKIFEAALSINEPWYIKNIELDLGKKRLDLYKKSTYSAVIEQRPLILPY
jgi:hypothetical protein